MKEQAEQVGKQFTNEIITDITALGNGLINDTFLVKTNKGSFVLQRINTQVFPMPRQIMENLDFLNKHIKNSATQVKLIIPDILKTVDQQLCYIDKANNYWRAIEFIDNTVSKEQVSDKRDAEQIGLALGHFHCLLSNIDVNLFHDTLPGFHITPSYFQHYQSVESLETERIKSKKAQQCQQFIIDFEPKIHQLENAKNKGFLLERIIHGDPKLNNFLFDKDTNKIVSLIDLDTVKPGLIHYDIADCLRSSCHKMPSNSFDLNLCGTILNGYFKEITEFFTQHDYDFLYPAIELIPFELGLRFFTDYLQGNKYFKVSSIEQNLDRAVAQFELCKNIAEQEEQIRQLIADIK